MLNFFEIIFQALFILGFAAYAQAGQWVYVPDQYEGKKHNFLAIFVISYFMEFHIISTKYAGTDISNIVFVKKNYSQTEIFQEKLIFHSWHK